MANLVNVNAVEFKKVSGWSNGPLKPVEKLNTTAVDSQVITSLVSTIQNDIPNMTKGETLTIICTIGDEA